MNECLHYVTPPNPPVKLGSIMLVKVWPQKSSAPTQSHLGQRWGKAVGGPEAALVYGASEALPKSLAPWGKEERCSAKGQEITWSSPNPWEVHRLWQPEALAATSFSYSY